MSKVMRFGVSLDESLLTQFDELCAERGYPTRSEAIRDLIRASLVRKEWEGENGKDVAGTLTLVYDHHIGNLSQHLTEIQHDFHHIIVATLHVHLDHHNCMETLVLKGQAAELRRFGDRIIATRGVKHGALSLATTGQGLK
ncbi:MAG: nickel-responsive transcriptional regulator NikR [Deltaproteobacteria bacterium]|nr:nickel-responsive transcriptional regulator NikR [Deltaproteobacteria bacterium]